jgi:hypothetical protein
LNSPRIGQKVELRIFQNFCLERSGKVWKELKNDRNEYKSSLGGRRQKPIGALNSSRIGEKVELENFKTFVWKGLERAKKMIKISVNRVWVVIDKNRLVH